MAGAGRREAADEPAPSAAGLPPNCELHEQVLKGETHPKMINMLWEAGHSARGRVP